MEAGILIAETSFAEATDYFKQFLSSQGLSVDLVWLFREDVIFEGDRFLIKVPVPRENDEIAATCYELGRKRNFGVGVHAFCSFQSRLCCYIVLPGDDLDGQYMLMSNVAVKYSVVSNLREAESIVDHNRHGDSPADGFNSHIPSKRTLLPEYPVVGAG